MKYTERIYSDSEIKLINEIFDMCMKRIYDEDLNDLIIQCKDMFLDNQRLMKENKRLNNIINEFDKWLEVNLTNLEKEETSNIYNEGLKQGMLSNGRLIKNKLQELKGSSNNG